MAALDQSSLFTQPTLPVEITSIILTYTLEAAMDDLLNARNTDACEVYKAQVLTVMLVSREGFYYAHRDVKRHLKVIATIVQETLSKRFEEQRGKRIGRTVRNFPSCAKTDGGHLIIKEETDPAFEMRRAVRTVVSETERLSWLLLLSDRALLRRCR